MSATQIYQRLSVARRFVIFKVLVVYLTKYLVGHHTKYLVGHLKMVMLKTLIKHTSLSMAPVQPDPAKMRTSSSLEALKAFFRIFLASSLSIPVRSEETLVVVCVFP